MLVFDQASSRLGSSDSDDIGVRTSEAIEDGPHGVGHGGVEKW
ncbi:MAG: hypothetical protein ABI039_09865 [Vicinamibacterales bacterium]